MSAKQKQHRPKHRAPHGSPIYTERIGAWVTVKQKRWVRRNGGSGYLRDLISDDMQRGK